MAKNGLGKLLFTGLKVFVVLIVVGLLMAIPTAIVRYTMTVTLGIGALLGLIALVLYFIVLGWAIIKFKGFIFGR